MVKLRKQADETDALLALVVSGRFLQVQAWFSAGKPVPYDAEQPTKCPLWLAVRSTGQGMVELLLQDTRWSPRALTRAVVFAVANDEAEIASMLFAAGADAGQVSPASACSGGGRLMEVCARAGVDLAKYNTFADALGTGAKPPLGALITLRKDFPKLEQQAAIALCRAIEGGHMGVIAKLVWAQTDPMLEVVFDGIRLSPVEAVICTVNQTGFAALRLRPSPAVALRLMELLCNQPNEEILAELLRFVTAAQLNSGPQGSCDTLNRLLSLRSIKADGVPNSPINGGFVTKQHAATLASIGLLVGHGAHWNPTAEMMLQVSRALACYESAYVEQAIRHLSWSDCPQDEEAAAILQTENRQRNAAIEKINLYAGMLPQTRRGRPPKLGQYTGSVGRTEIHRERIPAGQQLDRV